MSNPVRDAIGGNQNNLMQQFSSFRNNPMQFLVSRNISIPSEFQNDPRGAVQYLLNSGKLTQDGLNRLTAIAGQMGIKLG